MFACVNVFSNKRKPHWCCLPAWRTTKPSVSQIHSRKRMILLWLWSSYPRLSLLANQLFINCVSTMLAKHVLFSVASIRLCIWVFVCTKTEQLLIRNWCYTVWICAIVNCRSNLILVKLSFYHDLESYFLYFWIRKFSVTWKIPVRFWCSFTKWCILVSSVGWT